MCSRTIEIVKELRFSTRTLPLRSNSTPRGARSASVRWWLFSAISSYLRVLNDLQDPEADPQRGKHDRPRRTCRTDQPCADASSIFCYCHKSILVVRSQDLQSQSEDLTLTLPQCLDRRPMRRRSTTPGSDSMIVNAIIPTTALPSACVAIAFHGDGKLRSPSTTYSPMNTA